MGKKKLTRHELIDIDKIIKDSGVIFGKHVVGGPSIEQISTDLPIQSTYCVNTGRVNDPQRLAETINLLIRYFEDRGFGLRDTVLNSHQQSVDATLIFEDLDMKFDPRTGQAILKPEDFDAK